MQIRSFTLTNFRSFKGYSVDLARQFNLVVGDNGTGKTAILDALSIAASGVVVDKGKGLKVGRSRPIKPEEVRQESYQHGKTLTLEPQFPCVVECDGDVGDESGSWAFVMDEGRQHWGDAQWVFNAAASLHDHVRAGDPVPLPIVSYYGTERLWPQRSGSRSSSAFRHDSRLSGYKHCLNPSSNEERLLDWFRDLEFASLQQQTEQPTLEACRRAIATCISDSEHVYFDASLKQLVAIIGDDALPITYLSDGYRNMLLMVADIAIRCAVLNPQFGSEAALQTPGIVLIDELDLHLHPRWQRQVVTDLMTAFPRIQFVATTHSPFVIQSLPMVESVQLINLDNKAAVYTGGSLEDIAATVQGVDEPQQSQRRLEMMKKAQEYFAMLQEDSRATESDRRAARKELEMLSSRFSDSPAYMAFVKMQELASEKGREGQHGNTERETP